MPAIFVLGVFRKGSIVCGVCRFLLVKVKFVFACCHLATEMFCRTLTVAELSANVLQSLVGLSCHPLTGGMLSF